MTVIYAIINKANKKQYIGSTINFKRREKLHRNRLCKKEHHSPKLQAAWNKHKENSFQFIILEELGETRDRETILTREQWWIDNSNSEYNICKIAGSSLGVLRSKETRDKVRKANLGLKHPEWRNKIKSLAQGGENHWTKRKGFSEEAKKNMSEAQKKFVCKWIQTSKSKAYITI
jgi:group I intron endonuclease